MIARSIIYWSVCESIKVIPDIQFCSAALTWHNSWWVCRIWKCLRLLLIFGIICTATLPVIFQAKSNRASIPYNHSLTVSSQQPCLFGWSVLRILNRYYNLLVISRPKAGDIKSLKSKWRNLGSNSWPVALQAKSSTIPPNPSPQKSACRLYTEIKSIILRYL